MVDAGPVRASQVEEAQARIIRSLREETAARTMVIRRAEDDDLVDGSAPPSTMPRTTQKNSHSTGKRHPGNYDGGGLARMGNPPPSNLTAF